MPTLDDLEARMTRLEKKQGRYIQAGLVLDTAAIKDFERNGITGPVFARAIDESIRGLRRPFVVRATPQLTQLINLARAFEAGQVTEAQAMRIAREIARVPGFGRNLAAAYHLQTLTRFLGWGHPLGWAFTAAAQTFLGGWRGLPRNVVFLDDDAQDAELGWGSILLGDPLRVITEVPFVAPTVLMRPVRIGVPFQAPPFLPFQTRLAYENPELTAA